MPSSSDSVFEAENADNKILQLEAENAALHKMLYRLKDNLEQVIDDKRGIQNQLAATTARLHQSESNLAATTTRLNASEMARVATEQELQRQQVATCAAEQQRNLALQQVANIGLQWLQRDSLEPRVIPVPAQRDSPFTIH